MAVASAAFGAVLPLVGSIIAASAGNPPKARKHHTDAPLLVFTHHHATTLLVGAIVLGLGAIPIALALRYLFDATRFRHPAQPRIALYGALVGAGAILVTRLAFQIVVNKKSADFAINPANFAAGPMHAEAVAKHLLASGGVSITGAAGYAGGLALGFAFVMISLNAMRAGLLTRFMGIIGIFSGILFVLPVIPLPVVQSFWLGALAFLFAGRWPSGMPPAWESGQAEPWPSQQELRERRERGGPAAAGGRKRQSAPDPEPVAPTAGEASMTSPHPASKKRKRKKRR